MWDSVFNHVLGKEGLFAILFVALLITAVFFVRWVLKTNNDRENRYIIVIEEQSKSLNKIDRVQDDVDDIKSILLAGKGG
jgi:multidrug efflux pump subunit AcrB